jgi:rhodanese-related sulfurtransferase
MKTSSRARLPSTLAPVLLLLAALAAVGAARADDIAQVTQAQLRARVAAHDRALLVLDVRTPDEFAAGHVPGAINVPHDQVEARVGELEGARTRDVVVYCGAGKRAATALETLKRLGFSRLGHLEGDWKAWEAAGLPAERAPAVPGATRSAAPDTSHSPAPAPQSASAPAH